MSKTVPRCEKVYPRVCGGTCRTHQLAGQSRGLSPRVRGNPASWMLPSLSRGSIPACAGEPVNLPILGIDKWVYPRVCGGTCSVVCSRGTNRGLSPRVRGNLRACVRSTSRTGSIPACAGEPIAAQVGPRLPAVYPRVCGGTLADGPADPRARGLSPRVRGNPARLGREYKDRRSIPACAGKPGNTAASRSRLEVYPRVCGGTP